MDISFILCTHNPDPVRLRRTLSGLRSQSLAPGRCETLIVDNASSPPVERVIEGEEKPAGMRLVREPRLGLTFARQRGLAEARGRYCVLVDDDNVLASDYAAQAVRLLDGHLGVGAAGGRSLPEFEREPEAWQKDFFSLLALRDLGNEARISAGFGPARAQRIEYPVESAPIGAGMAVRREAVQTWLDDESAAGISDRRGTELTSGGDNDLVFSILRAGWGTAYFPELKLTHLIPASRLDADYLARLNRGIQKSWMQVLTKNMANPWPTIAHWTIPLRQAKAWLACRAWTHPSAYIRWQGICGHFEGRAE